MLGTGETVGLAEWIIDDTCLVRILLLSDDGGTRYERWLFMNNADRRMIRKVQFHGTENTIEIF